jgi:hypothetical protein|tara:strand:+ start:504 stop:683 length:180 start_codon:yes stop_codon:yes gene_type:complete
MVDTKDQNGSLYLGQEAAKDGFFTHQVTIDGNHYIESAVLAGPVSYTGTVTITGNVVIV